MVMGRYSKCTIKEGFVSSRTIPYRHFAFSFCLIFLNNIWLFSPQEQRGVGFKTTIVQGIVKGMKKYETLKKLHQSLGEKAAETKPDLETARGMKK